MERVKTILISQPKPETEKSPFFDLAKKHSVKIDFRPFIHVEGIDGQDFRLEKIKILDHTAVIFNSKNAADHFFRICEETRVNVPESMKYFCMSEAIALYLQKYVVYRKRRIFFGKQTLKDLMDVLKKHKEDKFLIPCSDIHKEAIPEELTKAGYRCTKAVLYHTVSSDLSDLADVKYDMLVFFSPAGIKSLFENFPDFEQGETRIAAFGATAQAVLDAGLRLDIGSPVPNSPSMAMALDQYITLANKKK